MPTSYIAAAWMTASQPSMPSRIAFVSPRSPGTSAAAEVGERLALLGRADQAAHLVAARAELAHDLAADEPRAAGHEDLHGRQLYSGCWPTGQSSPASPWGGGGAYNRLECSVRETAVTPQTRYGGGDAGVSNPRARQRALAIGISDGREQGDPLAELKELLRTAGVATAGEATQQRAAPDPDRYFGRGQLAELKEQIAACDANVVACDDELAPRQERNLEAALGCR